jgi:SAM-dependent methyltransferase
MKPRESLGADYFERIYAQSRDPWRFESSPYEAEKYRRSIAALPPRIFERGLEIGCSIGVLTRLLAPRCRHLLAIDVSETALQQAQVRCQDLPQVEFRQLQVPNRFPVGTFDLIVVSEVGYYWSSADLHRASDLIFGSLRPGGSLLLVHWTPTVDDYPGDNVHRHFAEKATRRRLIHVGSERQELYRLDLFSEPKIGT